MRRLIVAYTPYHVLLATAVLQQSADENHLVIVRDFSAAERMAAVLGRRPDQPYVSSAALGGCFGIASRLRRQFSYRRSAVEIARRAREVAPEEIWVGNDARPESHAAFGAVSRRGTTAAGVLVEDGMTTYAASVTRPLAFWEQAAGHLLFGRLWSGISVLGTSPLVSRGLFTHPDIVRAELSHLAKTPVRRDALLSPAMQALAADMVRVAGGDAGRLACVDAVVTVTHSSVAARSPDYRMQMLGLVRHLLHRNHVIGVKYHPRQAEPDYLGAGGDPRVMLLPRGLPLEYLYVLAAAGSPRRLQHVVGDVSTTLLTARWLVPDARVTSLGRPLGLLDSSIEQLFARLGISMPERLEPE
jgi:Alpha-2,8-polysialyltransferase (POLYST)